MTTYETVMVVLTYLTFVVSLMMLVIKLLDIMLLFFIYMQNQYKTNRINTLCLFWIINNVNLNYRRPEDL